GALARVDGLARASRAAAWLGWGYGPPTGRAGTAGPVDAGSRSTANMSSEELGVREASSVYPVHPHRKRGTNDMGWFNRRGSEQRNWLRIRGARTGRLALMSSLSALVACAPESVTTSPTPSSPSPEPASLSLALRADQSAYVAFEAAADRFPLATGGASAPPSVSSQDFPGVVRVAGHLRTDIGRVTGTEPTLTTDQAPASGEVVLIGTLGKSPLITQLVDSGKLDVAELEGRWDTFVTQVVDAPMTGVARALVIAGSNKRGTIYGMYELAAQIGVSPWHFWADVPPKQRAELHVLPGRHTLGEPKVKYRGFFINDENPALLGWFNATWNTGSGRFNSEFYERVFELLLRLRANYLWPAMWGKAFYDDDAKNGPLADEYGIVMGTSHHEP